MSKRGKALFWAFAGLVLGVGAVFLHKANPIVARLPDGRLVWPSGRLINEAGANLGQPEHTERVFDRLYKAIVEFRKREGRLPQAGIELIGYFTPDEQSLVITTEDLTSTDIVYSDVYSSGQRDHLEHLFDLRGPRPDGMPKPAFPGADEKDAWVSTSVYVRSNAKVFPDMTVKAVPSGFYIVLWSTGEVERIPVGELMWVKSASGLEAHFPGQTGMPKSAVPDKALAGTFNGARPANIPGPSSDMTPRR